MAIFNGITFISLVIYMELPRVMKNKSLFIKYSVKELLSELKKLKITKMDGDNLMFRKNKNYIDNA